MNDLSQVHIKQQRRIDPDDIEAEKIRQEIEEYRHTERYRINREREIEAWYRYQKRRIQRDG